jgi:anti-anti-sigma factor
MTDDARSRWQPPDQAGGRLRGAGGEKPPVLDQVFDDDSLYSLRAAVAAHASQAGMPEGRARDLVLAMHELAANAVRHGAGHGRLRLWATEDAVRCEITDNGAPKTADVADAGPRDAALWPVEYGHGLWLTRQVADQASWSSGPSGTVTAVSFRLEPSGQLTPFRLFQQFEEGCVILAVTGQLDLGSAGQFAAVAGDLIAATPGLRLVLDLSGLTLWDSSGLTALITTQRRISRDPAARIVLAGLPGHLVQRLHEVGVASRFTLAGTNADAVRMAVLPG